MEIRMYECGFGDCFRLREANQVDLYVDFGIHSSSWSGNDKTNRFDNVIADMNSHQHSGICTDKNIVADRNRADFGVAGKFLCAGIVSQNMHPRRKGNIIADSDKKDMARVKDTTVLHLKMFSDGKAVIDRNFKLRTRVNMKYFIFN